MIPQNRPLDSLKTLKKEAQVKRLPDRSELLHKSMIEAGKVLILQ